MKKILIIEDESPIRSNLQDLLEAEGFDALSAENGLIGLELARRHTPNLIICDVMMPELDGYQVLDALRQDTRTATIPFIFLTAKAEKADLRRGMNLGADDYLTKPFTVAELLSAISSRLSKHEIMADRYAAEIKQAEEKLNSLIYYDYLTQLPSSIFLKSTFEQRCPGRSAENPLPLLSLSIDRFHRINDSLGYSLGDLLLKAVADRLVECTGRQAVISRIHAGQFAILLNNIKKLEEVRQIAQNILNAISQPFNLEGHEIFVAPCMGIAFYPQDGQDFDTLLRNADAALSYVTGRGSNVYEFYWAGMNANLTEQLELEASLRYALPRNELRVYYQPQVDIVTNQIVGAEALLRWQHPEKGLVPPGKFIPLAEDTNLIQPMTEWVLKMACAQIREWQKSTGLPLRIAVNLSARQFSQANLGEKITQILQETGLEARYLELELTESVLMHSTEEALAILSGLQARGVHIAIDDFGTGYSSLIQLKRMPFDTLKIDQIFVRNVNDNTENMKITRAIIEMAHSLNLKVIAEGVETQAELNFLAEQNCDEVQGYYFSRPVPSEDFSKLLEAGINVPI